LNTCLVFLEEARPSNWIRNVYTTVVKLISGALPMGSAMEPARCHGHLPLAPELLDIGCLDYWFLMQHIINSRCGHDHLTTAHTIIARAKVLPHDCTQEFED
jgi:hypothetical protein